MWDAEVDLVCIGAGIGGLASAITSVDAGADVIVADTAPRMEGDMSSVATRRRVASLRGWLQHDVVDVDTDDYFSALTEGLDALSRRPDSSRVPIRIASSWSADERAVEPFVGSAIRAWDERCLASPYGMLCSSVFGWRKTRMRSSTGETIEIVPIGEVDHHDGFGEHDLLDWLTVQARQRDVQVLSASPLQRIVFENGMVAGVVLDTPEGPYAVRSRRGVTLSPRDHEPASGDRPTGPARGERKQVCLVGRTASRFGRVELVSTTAPTVPALPLCTASGAQLRSNLHQSRRVPSDAWRGGKMHRHPPLGK